MRTVDPTHHQAIFERFDHSISKSLEGILGAPLSDTQSVQVSYPVSLGGLGLRKASEHCSSAYLSSLGFSSSIITEARKQRTCSRNLEGPIAHYNSFAMTSLKEDDALVLSQKMLSHQIDIHNRDRLFGMAQTSQDLARLHSVSQKYAGEWLNAIPCKNLGLHMTSQEFIMAARYRLGMNVFSRNGSCPVPTCTKEMDLLGDHAMLCASSGERIAYHNRLRDVIYSVATEASLGPKKEEGGFLRGSQS